MDVTGNGEKDQAKNAAAPMAANSTTSAHNGKKPTKNALTASDRLEIVQQSLVDLGRYPGFSVEVSEIFENGERMVGIVLHSVRYEAGRLLAINGTGKALTEVLI